MVISKDKNTCCGCGACVAVCPYNAISLKEDEEGFLYPIIDEQKCVACGLCDKTCTFEQPHYKNEAQVCYIAQHKDESVCMASTSGGMYTAISDVILKLNGVIYACDFDDDNSIVHKRISTKEARDHSRGSKYVQSIPNGFYEQLIEDLKNGYTVGFFGTPCQVDGLLSCVNDKYKEKLYCIDVICNGVGSPMVWKQYAQALECKYKSKLDKYIFRPKTKGYLSGGEVAVFQNGKKVEQVNYCDCYNPFYHIGFISRPSCTNCKYASFKRVSDITIGDYSKKQYDSEVFDRNRGLSTVLVNSEKGCKLISLCENELVLCKCDYEDVLQIRLSTCAEENSKRREFLQCVSNKGLRRARNEQYRLLFRLKCKIITLLQRCKK